jgi:aspartyl/glutamyl-tRNA(Asn/Gln) amidotransferase C subunit
MSLIMVSTKTKKFSSEDVHKIAKLANIPVTTREEAALAEGFNSTLKVVDTLFSVDVKGVTPTSQVTGLENVLREDEIDGERQFTQDQALANAPRTHNGYFVVDQILTDD